MWQGYFLLKSWYHRKRNLHHCSWVLISRDLNQYGRRCRRPFLLVKKILTTRKSHGRPCVYLTKVPKPNQLALAWTTWVAVHKLRIATKHVRRWVQAEASSQRAQRCCELQEAWERRYHSLMWRLARKLGGKRNGPRKRFFNVPSSIRPRSSDWRSFLCGPRENGGC